MLDSLYTEWYDLTAGSWGCHDPAREQRRIVVSAQIDALEAAKVAQRTTEQRKRTARIEAAKAHIAALEQRRAA